MTDDKKFLSWILSIVLALVIFLVCLVVVSTDMQTYHFLWRISGVNEAWAGPMTHHILMFMFGFSDTLPLVLTEAEVSHLADVRTLINHGWVVLSFLLLIMGVAAFVVGDDCIWRRIFKRAAYILFLFPFALTITFPISFVYLHHIFFPQGNWTFDPATTTLVNLYPEEFFIGMFLVTTVLGWILATGFLFFSHHMRPVVFDTTPP